MKSKPDLQQVGVSPGVKRTVAVRGEVYPTRFTFSLRKLVRPYGQAGLLAERGCKCSCVHERDLQGINDLLRPLCLG